MPALLRERINRGGETTPARIGKAGACSLLEEAAELALFPPPIYTHLTHCPSDGEPLDAQDSGCAKHIRVLGVGDGNVCWCCLAVLAYIPRLKCCGVFVKIGGTLQNHL